MGLQADLDGMWDWLCVPSRSRPSVNDSTLHNFYPRQHDTALSASGRAQLRAHLAVDYFTHDALIELADAKNNASPCPGCPPASPLDDWCYGSCVDNITHWPTPYDGTSHGRHERHLPPS